MSQPGGGVPATRNTAPAGSREDQGHSPVAVRRRVSQLVARSTELGRPMRRRDALVIVLAYAAGPADGWDAWLRHRYDPTQMAALYNASQGAAS
jgi:hypothetical protein